MVCAIRQFYDGMRACLRLDDGECSDMFEVGQGLGQGCVLASMLFNMFFTAVLRVAEKRFIADAAIMDSIVQLQRKEKGEKKRGKTQVGKVDSRGQEEEPIRCGECCTLTMQASITITSRVGGDDDGCRDSVCGVQAYGPRGQDGDHSPENERWAGRCHLLSLQPVRCTKKRTSLCAWAGLSAQIAISVSR